MERRYLVVPGLRSSRIHITDTKPDPRQPKIVKIIEPETVFARTGYSRAHAGMQDTLELLRRNSHSAAEAVRAFTDGQFDHAVPVSLNADAPLTAQFLIEDKTP